MSSLLQKEMKALKFYNDIHMNDLTKGMPTIHLLKKELKYVDDKIKKKIILNDYHTLPTAGHAGIERTLRTIKQKFYWKNMKKDIEEFIKGCELCQRNKIINQRRTPMVVTTTASSAFETIYLDLVGPLLPSSKGHQYVLTTQCDLTKYVTATAIKNKTTETVAKAFVETIILNYGIPMKIVTDRGTEFMSKLFTEVCNLLKIEKLNSTAYHHQTIGGLENSHKNLGNFLRIYSGNTQNEWDNWIKYYQFAFNTTVHTTTNKTPYELVFGKICNLPSNLSEIEKVDPVYNIEDYAKQLKFKLQVSQKEVKDKILMEKSRRVEDYNISAEEKVYNKGDFILLKNETRSKLDRIYLGPYQVVQDCGANVDIQIGENIDRVHKARIKQFIML